MKKAISKGYTLEVTSWENDGDNYRTKQMVFETKEEALAVKHLCENAFAPKDEDGMGNLMEDDSDEAMGVILNYFVENPKLLKINSVKSPDELEKEIKEEFTDAGDDWLEYIYDYIDCDKKLSSEWHDIVMNYNGELLGYSEYYYSRICDSTILYYSDKDVFLEEVE